ncbi:MAG: DUF6171 family protein [Defluviitaleaceae bacterium]|nr:DUF6171 family protein [Defluviitaleaceae bacterium]
MSETQDTDIAAHIYSYIASIPEDIKASAALIQQRLDSCRACDNLANGMCKICGCYVEVRAVKSGQSCPDIYAKW